MLSGRHQLVDAWTRYWRNGAQASCTCNASGEVDLSSLWRDFFGQCAEGSCVLDLGTGNGAVLRHAVGGRLRLTGIDAADIDPLAYVANPTHPLREALFLGSVWMEDLPLADGAFDAASSQFGFEYADEEPASRELARVLSPGAVLRFVLHAHGGAVWRDVADRTARLGDVLAPDGALTLLGRAAFARASAGERAAAEFERALGPALARLSQLPGAPAQDDAATFYAQGALQLWQARDRYDAEGLSRALSDGVARAGAVLLRQQALLQAARTSEDISRLRDRFRTIGLDTASPTPIMDAHGERIAWLLDGRKDSASLRGRSVRVGPESTTAPNRNA